MDADGARIDADYGSSWLDEGTATIEFFFDGNLIGQNCKHGPYFLKGLLIFGRSGANLVSTHVVETQEYGISQFEGSEDCATSVKLDSFTAATDEEGIHLIWSTGIERNNAGFRLWRAIKDHQDKYVVTLLEKEQHFYQGGCTKGQLVIADTEGYNSSLLISAVGHSREGACYLFTDTSLTKDGSYYYVLEDIDTSGKRTFHCDAIAAITKRQGSAIDLEAAKNYCRQVTGSSH